MIWLRSAFLGVVFHILLLRAAYPQRIISTGPGITEILFALGLGHRVVGVTEYCKYPPEATRLPKVGSWMTPNLEVIVALRPDLVLTQRTAVHDSGKFRALELRTMDVALDAIPDILSAVDAIGAAAGVKERAQALHAQIQTGLSEIRERVSSKRRTPVLFVVGRNAGSLEGMIAVGPRSYLNEILDVAGGRNILADASVPYVKVVQEEILARNPHVIIDMGEHGEAAGLTEAQKRNETALWDTYPTVVAVRQHKVFVVANQYFVVPGPRVVECAREVARLLHPELFR